MALNPISRWPLVLPAQTVQTVLQNPLPLATSRTERDWIDVTIVVVTYNSLVFSKMCLESVLANSQGVRFEILVVDNGSDDGTAEYLRELSERDSRVRILLNQRNVGFPAANNQALDLAEGDYFVLLNHDTIVPDGWLTGLLAHLNDRSVGMVGPVTNRCGNEAQIPVPYETYGEFLQFAREYTREHARQQFEIRVLTMFCVAFPRDIYEWVGPLDESFGVGQFEDDDYSMRVRAAGYRVVCVEDVYVHHFGQAAIGKLAEGGEYGKLFHANRLRWEQKWGRKWESYNYRPNVEYDQLKAKIRDVVRKNLPAVANVIIVGKGDEDLLRLDCGRGWHFPQNRDGGYAGYNPADSSNAIAHLEELRARGAEFILFPKTSLWWLEHYREFSDYLKCNYGTGLVNDESCLVFSLTNPQRRES